MEVKLLISQKCRRFSPFHRAPELSFRLFASKLTPVAASNLLLSPTKSDSRWFGIDSSRLAVSWVYSGIVSRKASVLIASLYWFRERGRRPASRNVKIRT